MFQEQFVFLKGNMSDGFKCYGIYKDLDEIDKYHAFEEGWIMKVNNDNDGE